MVHFVFLFYLSVFMVGFVLLGFLVVFSIQFKDKLVIGLTPFYSMFTFQSFLALFESYLLTNLTSVFYDHFALITFVKLVSWVFLLLSLLNLIHMANPTTWSKWILIVFIPSLLAGFIYRATINKPYLDNALTVHGSHPDFLDIIGILIHVIALAAFISFMRIKYKPFPKFLVKSITTIFVLVVPATTLDTFRLLPEFVPTGSVVYLSFSFVLYVYLRKTFISQVTDAPVEVGIMADHSFLKSKGITQREQEIVTKLIAGKSNKDIAEDLCISVSTVKTHIYRVFKKLQVKNRIELIAQCASTERK